MPRPIVGPDSPGARESGQSPRIRIIALDVAVPPAPGKGAG